MTAVILAALLLPQVKEKTEIYLTEEQALKVVFGDAEVVRRRVRLDPEVKRRVERKLGRRIEGTMELFAGRKGGEITGFAAVTEEIGKYLPITFIVGVDPEGRVSEVAVMVHREPIGSDCRKERFTGQLEGKTVRDPVRKNRDILVIRGATLSCNGVARGVRKVLAVVDEVCLKDPAFLRSLQEEEITRKRYRMGTLCTITAKGTDAEAAVDAAFEEIRRIGDVISNYDEKTELSKLNRSRRIAPGTEFRRFLEASLRYAKETKGAFDPTIGAAVEAWGFRGGGHRVPSEEERKKLVVGWEKVRLGEREVEIPEGLLLDPGAIGKGYAVDRAVQVLRKKGIREGVVDFGSTVVAFGREWRVGIRDPFHSDRILGTVTIRDQALSISGNYEKFFEVDGVRYAHILDPRTRAPVRGVACAAVLAGSATEADVYSTAVFVDASLSEGRAALVVPDDAGREPEMTEGWKKRFRRK